MTLGGAAFGKPPRPEPPGLGDRIKALRRSPKTLALLAIVVILAGIAWVNGGSETWVTVLPGEMDLAVGESRPLTVSLMYKPPFLWRAAARPIPGTIQLISFPSGVEVTPTTAVTTPAQPHAVMQVTGLKPASEELDLGASNRPEDHRSWRTTAARVVVRP